MGPKNRRKNVVGIAAAPLIIEVKERRLLHQKPPLFDGDRFGIDDIRQ